MGWFRWGNKHESASEERMRFFAKLCSSAAYAHCEFLRAGVNLKRLNYIRGGYYIRKAWKLFQEADHTLSSYMTKHNISLEPMSKGEQLPVGTIYFGKGSFLFGTSLVPPMFRWMIKVKQRYNFDIPM